MFLLIAYAGLLIALAIDKIDEDYFLPLIFGLPFAGIGIIYIYRNPPPKKK